MPQISQSHNKSYLPFHRAQHTNRNHAVFSYRHRLQALQFQAQAKPEGRQHAGMSARSPLPPSKAREQGTDTLNATLLPQTSHNTRGWTVEGYGRPQKKICTGPRDTFLPSSLAMFAFGGFESRAAAAVRGRSAASGSQRVR